jgi:hypothetical protein
MATSKPPTPVPAPRAAHLTASMRVIASHAHMRRVTVEAAREQVLRVADRFAAGGVSREDDRLAAALTKATGCTVGELAVLAKGWGASG